MGPGRSIKSSELIPSFDYLTRAADESGKIRVLAARTTLLVEECRERHKIYPTVTAAIGRVLTAAALMGACLKGEETLTLRILGNGPVEGMISDANAKGEVRGYPRNPHVYVPLNPWNKLDVAGVVGNQGSLCVTYDLDLKKPYTGCTPLVSGEIAKDLVYYFYTSEQIPSIVSLGVLVGWDRVIAAGGILLQLLPGAEKSLIPKLEENAGELSDVSRLIEEGKTPEDLVQMVLKGMKIRALGKQTLHFKCRCSKEKLKDLLAALGEKEIRDILMKDGKAEASCPFCGHKYLIQHQELEAMLSEIRRK